MNKKVDTRAIGLDVGLSFIRWLTGAENLHYGLWTGLEVSAGNLRAAQDAYTVKLFHMLDGDPPLRILDIGGGAGETARKLTALSHQVEIVVPSAFLAERCRQNAPKAKVHQTTFEDFEGKGLFDICLFSESFQYIPMEIALRKSLELLSRDGLIVIADCFRTEAYQGRHAHGPKPGGGHRLSQFRELLAGLPLEVRHEEDITDQVAPSIDLEQQFFNVLGHGVMRIDTELDAKRPFWRGILRGLTGLVMPGRKRARLMERLTGTGRNAEEFRTYNRYLMLQLGQPKTH